MTSKKNKKPGRIPKLDPAKNRYVFYLNEADNTKFLALFNQSQMSVKSHFITSLIFNKPIKVVTIDRDLHHYYMRLTTFHSQFRAIGVNYNQTVRLLKSNFSEKKAMTFLYKLEQQTIELVKLSQQIMELTTDFERKYLQNNGG